MQLLIHRKFKQFGSLLGENNSVPKTPQYEVILLCHLIRETSGRSRISQGIDNDKRDSNLLFGIIFTETAKI